MPQLRIRKYKSDLAALRVAAGQQRDGKLRCDPNSAVIIPVDCVTEGGSTLTTYMFLGDLYILGFRGNGRDYFFDETQASKVQAITAAHRFQTGNVRAALVTAAWTGFGADYGSLGCHGVSRDRKVGKADLEAAITALAQYAGVSDANTRFHVACITHLVSEALRFREVEGAVAKAIAETNKGDSAAFTFGEFQELVTNWSALGSGTASTALKSVAHVKVMPR